MKKLSKNNERETGIGFKAAGGASIGVGFGKELKGSASFGLTRVEDDGSGNPVLRRVFITHGANRSFIEPIKEILNSKGLEPIVAIERQSVAQSLTNKILSDMRNSQAAIIHIDDENRFTDSTGKPCTAFNSNVLIEIGVALALYERRFILLVKEGIELPSNLKGLYEVRYRGETLDESVTERLSKAIDEMRM